MKKSEEAVQNSYDLAKAVYESFGVDTDKVIRDYMEIPLSLHCWQGDDVKGFEAVDDVASQNLVTGNYPGAARSGGELRDDIAFAFSMAPGKHRVNLHSIYAEPTGHKERCDVSPEDFSRWVAWAKEQGWGLDFNASFFTHPMMDGGFSLASRNKKVRDYWVKAGQGARVISDYIGRELGSPCFNNIWIPDGSKDTPANRRVYRENLRESLDRILETKYDHGHMRDVLEGKLFGIGAESFTVGSHEFYLAYAAKNGVGVCLDTGHYHPAESIGDKLSAVAPFVDDVMLHISRGIHWDSDHVVIQDDGLTSLMAEMKRGGYFEQVRMGLDYFDATINRTAAWIIGLRASGKAMLTTLLEPSSLLEKAEAQGDFTSRLALMEEFKNLPANAVWDMVCLKNGCPAGASWLPMLKDYESAEQSSRR